ncbi:class I SAM-dependent methyltransferase [Halobacillus sp. SY10]|uniref:Methyltransferase domain-containing protein n=2 Tax=Halobacillus TaxID=45667 RepID=A0A1H0UH68_HALAD|nr:MULTISPECIES: class I SAM-dependent methyltransferase [Halobacillus]RDY72369.1 class I SAM-dependent methyltransferase [Halobacillus trueperi]SDP65491.1 Methyltransferase domain-containing protein [Halobacillus aidingensis]
MIYNQFAKPEGLAGKFAGMFMERENRELNDWTLSFLDIEKDDRVLEVGFGSGSALKKIAALEPEALYGIDPSEAMVEMVLKKLNDQACSQQIGIFHGDACQLLHFHKPLDKIYAVNNITFWDRPVEILRHLRTLLSEKGKIALTIVPHEKEATDDTTEVLGGQMQNLLVKAGFRNVWIHYKSEKPNDAVCVTGMKNDMIG